MKVVLDTNVLMSGIFFGGVPGQILRACLTGEFELAVSKPILAEYERVSEILEMNYPEMKGCVEPVLDRIRNQAIFVANEGLNEWVCADPDDDKFLSCALASDAAFIITGDHALLELNGWREIAICSPRQFYDANLSA